MTNLQQFTMDMENLCDQWPDYEIVVCNCPDCTRDKPFRHYGWTINHAERRIYL